MESILSLPKNCMVFLRIIPVKKVDEVHRIVYKYRISGVIDTGSESVKNIATLNGTRKRREIDNGTKED